MPVSVAVPVVELDAEATAGGVLEELGEALAKGAHHLMDRVDVGLEVFSESSTADRVRVLLFMPCADPIVVVVATAPLVLEFVHLACKPLVFFALQPHRVSNIVFWLWRARLAIRRNRRRRRARRLILSNMPLQQLKHALL